MLAARTRPRRRPVRARAADADPSRDARRGAGAAARRPGPLRVQAGACRKAPTPRPWQRRCSATGPTPVGGRAARATCSRRVTRVTDRLATFLTLAGLTALLSGGLGIALTIETHLARRTATIATLKSLGASGGQVFAIYLAQVMLLAVAGVVLGLALGLVLPLADPAGAGGHVADLARARGLCRPSRPRRFGRAAHHLRVRRVAARDRTRDFSRTAVSRDRGADAAAGRDGATWCCWAWPSRAWWRSPSSACRSRSSAPGSSSPSSWRRSCSGG